MTIKASCGCVVEDFEDIVTYSRKGYNDFGERCIECVSNCKECHEVDVKDNDILYTDQDEMDWLSGKDSVSYSTNWMGPINTNWFINRGLTEFKGTGTVETEFGAKMRGLNIGDTYEIHEVTTYYSCGRIDIRDSTKMGYDGWGEYSVAPMHGEDWNALGDFLWNFKTDTVLPYKELIEEFEKHYGKKIRWAHDRWCEECFMEGFHKMDCTVRMKKEWLKKQQNKF